MQNKSKTTESQKSGSRDNQKDFDGDTNLKDINKRRKRSGDFRGGDGCDTDNLSDTSSEDDKKRRYNQKSKDRGGRKRSSRSDDDDRHRQDKYYKERDSRRRDYYRPRSDHRRMTTTIGRAHGVGLAQTIKVILNITLSLLTIINGILINTIIITRSNCKQKVHFCLKF